MARAVVERHGGAVPRTMEELTHLPGVGRKTANVILGNAFGVNDGVVVDTHVARLAKRLGLTRETDPVKIERALMPLFPREQWTMLSHLLIEHGRRVCDAKKPKCGDCVLADLCPSADAMSDPRRYWLVKTDAESFSWSDLWKAPKRTTSWTGVRNYQARNTLRDGMKRGDLVFFYHSGAEASAIVGVCEVVREGLSGPDRLRPEGRALRSEERSPRADLDHRGPARGGAVRSGRSRCGAARREGSREDGAAAEGEPLSVMPVTAREWAIVMALAE